MAMIKGKREICSIPLWEQNPWSLQLYGRRCLIPNQDFQKLEASRKPEAGLFVERPTCHADGWGRRAGGHFLKPSPDDLLLALKGQPEPMEKQHCSDLGEQLCPFPAPILTMANHILRLLALQSQCRTLCTHWEGWLKKIFKGELKTWKK